MGSWGVNLYNHDRHWTVSGEQHTRNWQSNQECESQLWASAKISLEWRTHQGLSPRMFYLFSWKQSICREASVASVDQDHGANGIGRKRLRDRNSFKYLQVQESHKTASCSHCTIMLTQGKARWTCSLEKIFPATQYIKDRLPHSWGA